MGKTPIFYQETFEAAQRIHKSLPKNTIVGVWYNGEMAGIVARAGLRYSVSTLPMKMTKIFIRSNCFLRAIYMHGFYLDMVVCKKNMFSLYCSINEMICVLCLYMYSTEDTSIFKICGSQCISMYTPTWNSVLLWYCHLHLLVVCLLFGKLGTLWQAWRCRFKSPYWRTSKVCQCIQISNWNNQTTLKNTKPWNFLVCGESKWMLAQSILEFGRKLLQLQKSYGVLNHEQPISKKPTHV
jgi:hypothetical protein